MLLNCIVYQKGAKLADVPVADISDHVGHADRFVWVALRDADDAELAQMQEEFGLHELAVEDARHGHQRPKIEEYGDSIFAVVHTLELVDGEVSVGEVNIFVGANYVLSVRNRSARTLLGVRERCEREPHLLTHGAGFVFYALMDAVVDRYFPVIEALETELEDIEAQIFEKQTTRENLQRLYELKSKIQKVRHAIVPLMEAVGKLHSGRVPKVCGNSEHYFRDVYDHLARISAATDRIRETIATAIQVTLSMVSIEQSEIGKRLAAWAGIFAVVTAFVGIWGMNFRFMPELEWQYGYPVALALIALVSGFLYRKFRKAGWL